MLLRGMRKNRRFIRVFLPVKLELFARRHRPGWVCLGDAITSPEIADDLWDLANGYERPFLEQAGILVPA